jgi:hypothetical protein
MEISWPWNDARAARRSRAPLQLAHVGLDVRGQVQRNLVGQADLLGFGLALEDRDARLESGVSTSAISPR